MEENCSTSEHVLRLSGYYNRLNQVGVNLPNKRVIDKSSPVAITKLLEFRDELYNMQGKLIPELFVVLKAVKVEIKKEHQVLMIDKTTSFKKRAKGRRGTSRRTASKLLLK